MKSIRCLSLLVVMALLLSACDRTPKIDRAEFAARGVIVDRWLKLRDDPVIVDWVVDPWKNTDLDITKADSTLKATLSLTHFQKRFTARYLFEFMNGRWVLIRSEQKAPDLIDTKVRNIMSGQ